MAPVPPTTRRPPSRATTAAQPPPAASSARITRLRAAKEPPSNDAPTAPSTSRAKTPGLLARGKEGLRTVSDKMKNKEKEPVEKVKKVSTVVEESGTSAALQAFLRIRSPPSDVSEKPGSKPYLEPQNEKEVLMRAPIDPSRPHAAAKPPLVYSFDKVFAPSTSQSSFFTTTTLPLVERLLQGENALMFAFGVSNSGKSYTISGGATHKASDRGLLPRSIDVIFNSIQGLESQAALRCHALADIEIVKESDEVSMFGQLPSGLEGRTDEAVKVDKNYSYAVFVSYVEVYNEKIFDLLDAVLPANDSNAPRPSTSRGKLSTALPRGSSAWAASSMNLAALANGGGGVIRRQALALKNDPEGAGKYIAGLKEIRVRTREEALAIFRAGQRARQVFGTLANRESSRSHGVFTTKIVRIHNGAPNDPESAQVSRLSIVDLAGSERTSNTGVTGDRLKEAGNINKSLMVLGQCLEVLRSNQQKLASSSGPKKRLAMVPFRHSKLTEIFQNFFVGDGRAVMIVNVNPYDTGFDENSHVMRFSAIAREVQTTAANKVNFGGGLLRRQISTQFSAFKNAVSGPMKVKVVVPVLAKDDAKEKTTTQRESDDFIMVEEELEVVEEDAEESEDEDKRDALVDHLFEQLREMKEKLFESEMRNAAVESEVREEAAKEMQDAIQRMHDDFSKRLQEQVNAGQLKTDRKIDILSRTIATPAPVERQPLRPGQTFLASTPDVDMDTSMDDSNDASFESAIDESLIVGTISPLSSRPRMSDVTDPFVAKLPLAKEIKRDDEEGSEEDLTEDEDMDSEDDLEAELRESPKISMSPVTGARKQARPSGTPSVDEDCDISRITAATDDSEDVLDDMSGDVSHVTDVTNDQSLSEPPSIRSNSQRPMPAAVKGIEEEVEDVEEVEVEGDEAAEEDEEDVENEEGGHSEEVSEEGSEEEEEDSEEDSEDDEEEEDEEDVSDSSFDASEEEDRSVSSVSPSPVRRQSTKRQGTVSPKKRAAPRTPTKKAAAVAKPKITPKRDIMSPPLSEKADQNVMVEDSDDEDIQPVKSAKKKRTLGKKIVMEDEMFGSDLQANAANIKRMTPKSVIRG